MSICFKVVNYLFDFERVVGEMKGSKILIWVGIVISKIVWYYGLVWVVLKVWIK